MTGSRRDSPRSADSAVLRGREAECGELDRVLAAARGGESQVLVVRGDAGVGKSALLHYAANSAHDLHILRAVGVESDMELAFAALHQLCAPVLDRLTNISAPQSDALKTVFGIREGAPPDRFLVGLAVLSLLSDASEERPLLCLVDDAQWLDRASAQVLGFVARRLLAESLVLLFGARQPGQELLGLPELEVTGLRDADAHALLDSVTHARLDQHIRDRVVAETKGNPLALLELPRGLTASQMAGGFGLPHAGTLPGRIEQSFATRIEDLPDETRHLLLLASAEPTGDPALLWRAAERLSITRAAFDGDTDGLLSIGHRVTFRHPLVRSAVYRAGSAHARREAHLALADVTDQHLDPDRRAWHLAAATVGPTEAVAEELERSAGRAQARGGLAAAAAFLQRSVELTEEIQVRVRRALNAAQVSLHAGEFDLALRMVIAAEAGSADEADRARALLLRGQIAFASGHGGDAPPTLLSAASKLQPLDLKVARETYLEAWGAALFAGGSAADNTSLFAASAAAMNLPPADNPGPSDILLEGLATLMTSGRRTAAPILRRATAAFAAADAPVEQNFRWGWLTTVPSNVLWDEHAWDTINARQLALARAAGALARLPIDLTATAILVAWRGDFAAAAAVIAEADAVIEMTDTRIAPFGAMLLAALRGREAQATALFDFAVEGAVAEGQGIAVQYARWVSAILFNSLGRYEQAFAVARQATAESPRLFLSAWALPELVEASARTDNAKTGRDALEQLAEAAAAADNDWARGVEARSRALMSVGDAAETCYQEAVERLGRTQLRPELARAHLLYGEWLRRQSRRVDARLQLRTAYDLFATIGMEAFAERARRELLATGETVRKRAGGSAAVDELTAQERQIAMLVRDGLTNPEVGARLFLSPRTVEWHLRKVFAKVSISSRKELREALPDASDVHR